VAYLGDIIERLEQEDPELTLPVGWEHPHSWRGSYSQLAFELVQRPTTVGELLTVTRSAVGATYTGWKGGEFTMGSYSGVYLAEEGTTGDALSMPYLDLLIQTTKEKL
jgi:hypothetical protein